MRPRDFTFEFSKPFATWSINKETSVSRYSRAEFRRYWRNAAYIYALGERNEGRLPRFDEPCTIQITLPVPRLGGRRDPSNYHATTKPIIDGLVDAKIFPDDSEQWLQELPPRFAYEMGFVTVDIWKGFLL